MAESVSLTDAAAEMQYATDCLSKSDIVVLKSFATPPDVVVKVLNAVIVVLGLSSPQSWVSIRRGILSNIPAFVHKLRIYRPDTVTIKTLVKLRQFMNDKDFHLGQTNRVCKGLSLLIVWLRAVFKYGISYHSM